MKKIIFKNPLKPADGNVKWCNHYGSVLRKLNTHLLSKYSTSMNFLREKKAEVYTKTYVQRLRATLFVSVRNWIQTLIR